MYFLGGMRRLTTVTFQIRKERIPSRLVQNWFAVGREREDHFIIPCYFIESDRFNHGLTSSALFFPFPLSIPIGSVRGITGNSQLFREREA